MICGYVIDDVVEWKHTSYKSIIDPKNKLNNGMFDINQGEMDGWH